MVGEDIKAQIEKEDFNIVLFENFNAPPEVISANFIIKRDCKLSKEEITKQIIEDLEDLGKFRKLKKLNKLKKELED